MKQGKQEYENQNYENAIEILKKAILLDHRLYPAYQYIGLSYKELNMYGNYRDVFIKLNEYIGFHVYVVTQLTHCLISLGKFQEIIKYYESDWFNHEDKFNALNWNNIGAAFNQNLNHKKAIEFFNKAISLDSKLKVAWQNKINALFSSDMVTEAIQTQNEFIEVFDEEKLAILLNMSIFLIRIKKYIQALEKLELVLEIDQNSKEALYYKGLTLNHLSKNNEALDILQQLVSLNPEYTDAWILLGDIFQDMNLLDKANQACDNAIDCGMKSKNEHPRNLGVLLTNLRRLDESELLFLNIIEKQNDDDNAHYNLACIYSLRNKLEKCILHLEQAIKNDKLNVDYLSLAKNDADFNKIREKPEFIQFLSMEI